MSQAEKMYKFGLDPMSNFGIFGIFDIAHNAVCIPALTSNCNVSFLQKMAGKSPADLPSSDHPETIAMKAEASMNYVSYQHLRLCKPK